MAELSSAEFGKRLRACWAQLRAVLRRFADGADADDLAQEVVVRAWEGRHQLRDPEAFGPWLKVIALNLGRASLRRRPSYAVCSLHLAEEQAAPDPAPGIDDRQLLEQALAALTAAEHETLALRAAELTTREIAEHLGEPEGTVRARLSRTRHKLRAHLRRHGWTSLGRDCE